MIFKSEKMMRQKTTKKNFYRTRKTANPLRIRPEADAALKKVFAKIGKPPSSATFVPDKFQLQALEAINRMDCLVIAPTGSGKTWIAEQAIMSVFAKGGRCWYASPLKALTNAKWVEFGSHFESNNVGILTGDTKENADAPIIVGTTEILRNQLYDAMYRGDDLNCDLVILDEAHFLGDRDRGVVWEEIMIYLPARINLLLLSATIGNGDEIASWLTSIRGKECLVVTEKKRPVPLYPLFFHPTGRLMPYLEKRKLYSGVSDFLNARRKDYFQGKNSYLFGEIINVLDKFNLLPAIFFLKSRAECDAALKNCPSVPVAAGDSLFHQELEELLNRSPYLKKHKQLHYLMTSRVAAHHAGQLPSWKLLVETMMNKGRLHAIFATSTVAAGVNFPARTIVLFNSDAFNGHEFSPLKGTEFHQMMGRAGRRGQDEIGFMLAIPGRFMEITHIKRLLFMEPEDIMSQIRNDFSMVLNLLLSQDPEDIRNVFEKSLATYQRTNRHTNREAREGGLNLWNDFTRHLNFLKAEGFVNESNRLTENGIWASKLRLDQPLLIAECLRQHVFPDNDEKLLAALIAPFVYDGNHDFKIYEKKSYRKLISAYDKVVRILEPLSERMETAGFPAGSLFFWTSALMYDWARGGKWEEIVQKIGIAEGDMAMLILRTADNLRQIKSLKDTHPEMAALAVRARETILREPVVFE
ncbi:MAG: DEAD/DEAH box helicase [Syntrophales bacterium]|nr:DEAD/DEAH box helicase [Syntrophales bacterium]